MAHNIANINGIDSVFLADDSAWHGLGQVVVGAQSWLDAMNLANLNWNVDKQPLYDRSGNVVPYWGIFRDGQVFLGAVGKSYTPIQNQYAFEFVDTLLAVANGAHYESAGALGNGEKIWTLARVPYDYSIGGVDKHQTYLLFTTSHDGSLAATCKLTSVRVVCQNTLNQALAMNGSFTRVKHTRQAEEKLEKAKKLMHNAVTGVKDIEEKLNLLSQRMMDKESYTAVLDKLFPGSDNGDNKAEISGRKANILLEITRLFESNDNNAFPEFRGTAYNLLNAVTEYTDHHRTVRLTDSVAIDRPKVRDMVAVGIARKEQALFGTGDALKAKALDTIIDLTKDAKIKDRAIYSLPSLDTSKPPTGNVLPKVIKDLAPGAKKPEKPIVITAKDSEKLKSCLPASFAPATIPTMQGKVATLPDGATVYVRESESKDGLKVVYVSDKEYVGELVHKDLHSATEAIKNKWKDATMLDRIEWSTVN